jgi:asparagine synthase (glutamine-hydrolysing)
MLAAQGIYGPHDGRQWADASVAMGRRLFRTLPEDVHDHQPLVSGDGRLAMVADVRLDNRDELAAALGLSAGEASQFCDAAILLASLERWGENTLDRLAGEFAFALWDTRAQSFMLARDFLGQRPLHYHRARGLFAFATMPKGLHALAEIPRAADEQTILELLALLPQSGPRSFYREVSRVEPGHIVTVTRDGLASRGFWQPNRPRAPFAKPNDQIEGLRFHLDQATQSCLRGAKGAVGAQLSGGLDSAAVTATAAKLTAPTGGKVFAFTAIPREGHTMAQRERRFADEGPLAAATATLYANVEHVLIRAGLVSPLVDLDGRLSLLDGPTANLSNWVWGDAINQAARERGLTVLLTGQMGNLTLSYSGLQLLPELLRRGRLVALRRAAAALIARKNMNWRGAFVQAFGPFTPNWLWRRIFPRREHDDVLQLSGIRAERLAELDLPALARARGYDLTNALPSDGFTARVQAMCRFDRNTKRKGILAGAGIDLRDPTADKRLVEYCLSIPTEAYLSNGVPRALAKRMLADRLPRAVLSEQRRGYQAADWHEGLTAARGEITAELARMTECPAAARMLDIERLTQLVNDWPTAGWERDETIRSYRWMLLRCISAGHFLRKAPGTDR